MNLKDIIHGAEERMRPGAQRVAVDNSHNLSIVVKGRDQPKVANAPTTTVLGEAYMGLLISDWEAASQFSDSQGVDVDADGVHPDRSSRYVVNMKKKGGQG